MEAVSSESVVEGSVVVLSCEVYGYPRNSSSPVWTSSHDLQSGRFSVSNNSRLLTGNSVALNVRFISQLTIVNVTMEDAGEYTCSVQGNSTTITLVVIGKFLCILIFCSFLNERVISIHMYIYYLYKQILKYMCMLLVFVIIGHLEWEPANILSSLLKVHI